MKGFRIVWPKKEKVEIEGFSVGSPKPGEILVKTTKTLISPGTERAWLMAMPNTPNNFPIYPGYSHAGVVIEVGGRNSKFKVGDRIASASSHATHAIIPEENVFKIPEGVSDAEACFYVLGSTSLQGVRKADIELGEPVVVIGQGIVGLMAMQFARLNGGMPVIALDNYSERLKLSKKYGADYALNPGKGDTVKRIKEITNGKGANVVIEATGNPKVISQSFKMCANFARIVLLGSPRGEDIANFYPEIHCKGIIIIGAHTNARPDNDSSRNYWAKKDDHVLVLNMLKEKRLRVAEMINYRTSYKNAKAAYKSIVDFRSDVLGIILDWSSK